MEVSTDVFIFCHYPGLFGFLLGIFQYLPIVLTLGAFFWSILTRDAFFLSLSLVMKVSWIIALLFKYIVLPGLSYTTPLPPNECESYLPSVLNYVAAIFATSTTTTTNSSSMVVTTLTGTDFPQVDVMVSGIYSGYILIYLILFKPPFSLMSFVGLTSISFVPWSFISAGANSVHSILWSYVVGLIVGVIGFNISRGIVRKCNMEKKGGGKTRDWCYHFWCGAKESEGEGGTGLFFYDIKREGREKNKF